ncbi:glutamine--fructose-6-phosphate transaminase (isomerizing) [Dehalogenimonas etheniformans]|uniref:glutamine--fructose-6-phosphate transaminase (isomerizing) n=1 Tax=Dehalogenimonas etheniformans TaxID=1536648 RepID=UPI00167F6D95|nr:glutamine--fructose-6-phosphate transaminase (isomerizing) [Dehalogenimonas etheniformans]QNT75255.1 glutamine--fructose-6-phosphate transaminase (isomerizing) [Dehalogenimonas etheniformans]
MCGIVGYIGNKSAQFVLLRAMEQLEYRGYDSSGIAVLDDVINVYKGACRVGNLRNSSPRFVGTVGIGHTRWATHGEPSKVNAHPHLDCGGKIALVHNGVVSNYRPLKEKLIAEGHVFLSETDTEVIPHLIEKHYTGNLEQALAETIVQLKGSYAIVAIAEGEHKLVFARQQSPLVIGIGESEILVASDIPPLLEHTNKVIYLEDGEIGVADQNSLKILKNGKETTRAIVPIDWSADQVEKNEFEHFMLKEIYEQPRIINQALEGFFHRTAPVIDAEFMRYKKGKGLLIFACGTSYHAGLIGKYVIEELLDIPVRVELASEVNHRERTIPVANVIAITQSGETADVLTSLSRLKQAGCATLAITNVKGSSVTQLADKVTYTHAGPEFGVAATKTFIAQLMELYRLALLQQDTEENLREQLIVRLSQLPDLVQSVIDNQDQIKACSRYLTRFSNVFFIGRGINYPVALEGALKLKEISYIHAEGYAAGELKHGPFSLLQQDTPVVAIVNRDACYDAMVTNIKEIKSRKAPVIALVQETDTEIPGLVDFTIRIPVTHTLLSPIINTVALQLLAYFAAKFRDCPIDFPRNLAKSVTVE